MSRKRAVTLGVAAAALGLVALALSDWPARWLVLRDPVERVDAAVVLAGDPGYERTRTAAERYHSGHVRLLVVTGGEPGPGDSAGSLRDRAIRLGVPAERIRMETISHNTREALLAVAPILRREGVKTVALVTSPYHQRRTYLVARRALPGVRILNWPASPSVWRPQRWWRDPYSRRIVLSEFAKLSYYALKGWLA